MWKRATAAIMALFYSQSLQADPVVARADDTPSHYHLTTQGIQERAPPQVSQPVQVPQLYKKETKKNERPAFLNDPQPVMDGSIPLIDFSEFEGIMNKEEGQDAWNALAGLGNGTGGVKPDLDAIANAAKVAIDQADRNSNSAAVGWVAEKAEIGINQFNFIQTVQAAYSSHDLLHLRQSFDRDKIARHRKGLDRLQETNKGLWEQVSTGRGFGKIRLILDLNASDFEAFGASMDLLRLETKGNSFRLTFFYGLKEDGEFKYDQFRGTLAPRGHYD